jgi:hypothetical protein
MGQIFISYSRRDDVSSMVQGLMKDPGSFLKDYFVAGPVAEATNPSCHSGSAVRNERNLR